MRLIEEKLGIEFYVEKDKLWPQVVEDVKDKRLDIFPCVASNPQREKYLNFTRPYLSFPMVITTLDTSGYIDGVNRLKHMSVGVVEGYATHEYFEANHPDINVKTYKSATDGLKDLSKGKIDAFVGNLATTSYLIPKIGLTNLKISGEMPIRYDLGVGIRKDWPELAAIMQQAFDSITDEQKNEIHNRWIGVRYEYGFDYSLFWKILGVFVLVLGVLYFYNRKLAEEVGRRKFAEQELKHMNKELLEARDVAQSANMAKTDFLSRMSHELRTPLTAIIGFAELFSKDNNLDEEHKKDAYIIHSAGQHLLNIINDLLDLSKIESDNIEIEMKDISLNKIVNECFNLIKPLAAEHDIQVINNVTTNSAHMIYADYTRTKQVLINLLSNAVKYNKSGGTITISHEIVDDRIRIKVIDTGKGLIKQQIEKLFNPFDRAGAEDSQIKGTGIGLVISKRLIERMGGSIGVESEPGQGSTFWIDLNLSQSETPSVIKENPIDIVKKSTTNGAKTILYIEDIEPNIRLVSHILKKHTNHNLITASSAKIGLEMANVDNPDLILLDIGLPEMDGYEVLKHLMDNEKTQHIPVVALSANAMKVNVQRALDEGFKDYLTKPIEVKNLLTCINNI
ncbi:MAG TPA: transporter substrate-binding domain-containing protein [Thermodesulfobacteriota bacterium]|nr:transporter substrate-binding domain-containing protein [Thermodesulfobacteriota bacterium]